MPRNAEGIISSWEQVAAVLQVEGNHADVCLPGFIKALVFTCHTRVPARVMTWTVAITTLECRGLHTAVCVSVSLRFTPVSVLLRPSVTKWPAAQ